MVTLSFDCSSGHSHWQRLRLTKKWLNNICGVVHTTQRLICLRKSPLLRLRSKVDLLACRENFLDKNVVKITHLSQLPIRCLPQPPPPPPISTKMRENYDFILSNTQLTRPQHNSPSVTFTVVTHMKCYFWSFRNFDSLIPDAPELIGNFLEGEQDASCKRNAFMMLIHADQVQRWYNYYRPQRSCGKVMFSQASVILFTGGGGVGQTHHPTLQRTVRILLECILVQKKVTVLFTKPSGKYGNSGSTNEFVVRWSCSFSMLVIIWTRYQF